MKKYTFYTTGKTNDIKNNNSSNNYSQILDDIISANILKANPYFAEFETPKKSKTINIDIEITKTPKCTIKDDQYEAVLKAIELFYSKSISKDIYDFKLPDGTPVKKFHDEIQIGYELFPLNSLTDKIYEYLKDMNKEKVIEFYVNLPKKTKKEINILIA